MRVALIARATLFDVPGGDTRQMEETAKGLRALGIAADVVPTSRTVDYSRYDLLHFFNLARPADFLRHIRRSGKPYVVSPVFVEYESVNEAGRSRSLQAMRKFLSGNANEYAKVLARAVRNGETIVSPEYLWRGQARSMAAVLRGAGLLLPNSRNEYGRIARRFASLPAYRVIPNGVDAAAAAKTYPESPLHRGAVLCMGRIESVKNQLSLIRALNGTPYRLVIHGAPAPNHRAYYERCRREAAPNVHFGERLNDDDLFAAFACAKVHVLPSFFETTGLSSLEAAAMGCNIVITDRGDTREYFREEAWYCDPDKPESIRAAVEAAYRAPVRDALRARILKDYTWSRAAEETHRAYREVLGRGRSGAETIRP
jgi:glycosyltransferase involved in cell wall biosynthesis